MRAPNTNLSTPEDHDIDIRPGAADAARCNAIRELVYHEAIALGCTTGQAAAAVNAALNWFATDYGSSFRACEEGRRFARKLLESAA